MNARTRIGGIAMVAVLAGAGAGCGEYVRSQGRSPSMVVITALEGASGADPDAFGGTLSSDVITVLACTPPGSSAEMACPTIYGDAGRVSMRLVLKDPGSSGFPTTPSALNQVVIERYRVAYERTDGRNAQGVDVPYAFESAVTFTVPSDAVVTFGFLLVRNTAKAEAPLAALRSSSVMLSTIATITFYGRDLAGNEVIATGRIGVTFGNFGDPS